MTPWIVAIAFTIGAHTNRLWPTWWPIAVFGCIVISAWRVWTIYLPPPAWAYPFQMLGSLTWLILVLSWLLTDTRRLRAAEQDRVDADR